MPEQKTSWTERDITQKDMPAIYEALSEKFPPETVQEAKTNWGEILGVRSQFIANRLNEVVGPQHWKYEIVEKESMKIGSVYVAWVKLRLMIGNPNDNPLEGYFTPIAVREYYGGCSNPAWHEALKGAVTNTFKKTASMFGMAKEVYEGTMDEDFSQYQQQQSAAQDPATVDVFSGTAVTSPQAEENAATTTNTDVNEAVLRNENVQKYLKFMKEKVKDAAGYQTLVSLYDRSKDKFTDEQKEVIERAMASVKKKYAPDA